MDKRYARKTIIVEWILRVYKSNSKSLDKHIFRCEFSRLLLDVGKHRFSIRVERLTEILSQPFPEPFCPTIGYSQQLCSRVRSMYHNSRPPDYLDCIATYNQ